MAGGSGISFADGFGAAAGLCNVFGVFEVFLFFGDFGRVGGAALLYKPKPVSFHVRALATVVRSCRPKKKRWKSLRTSKFLSTS